MMSIEPGEWPVLCVKKTKAFRIVLRLRLHEIRCIWNRYKIDTDKPWAYTGPLRLVPDRLQIGSPIRYQMGSLLNVNQFGTVRFQCGTMPV